MDLFDDSDDIKNAENGVILTYAAASDFVRGWYETTEEMNAVWEQRRVFTGVFIKRGDAC